MTAPLSQDSTRHRAVVVHLADGGDDRHEAVLRTVAHLADDLGADATIELVAHGPGITICLRDDTYAAEVQELIARGVIVAACANTMARQHIDLDALALGVVTVASGVAELTRKQWEGWAYVRP